jgi:uncharacterized protein (DUF58 family)
MTAATVHPPEPLRIEGRAVAQPNSRPRFVFAPFWRLLYRSYRIVSGLKYWTLRRFTRAGLGVIVGLVAAAMIGPDTENNVAYQGFTLLLFLLLISMSFGFFFRIRFTGKRILPRCASAGQPVRYRVTLRNLSPRRQNGLTLVESLADTRPNFHTWRALRLAEKKRARAFRISRPRKVPHRLGRVGEAEIPAMLPGQEVDVPMELLPLKRGLLRLDALTIARSDPLGLFRSLASKSVPQTIVVLPRRYYIPPISLPGAMRYQAGGVALASNVGQSDEFVALRDYRRGDPLRHIHWRSWARTGKPVVKEFEDEFFVRHALVLDTFAQDPGSPAFEEAISLAASFACALPTQESLLDLLFVGTQSYCFTAGRGLAHSDQMLEILAGVQPAPDEGFERLENLVLNHIRSVSGCIVVFLSWDAQRKNFTEKMRAMGVPLLVFVVTEAGQGAKITDPGPMRDDPAHFHVLEAGAVEAGLRKLE